jgi:hypothetical protein
MKKVEMNSKLGMTGKLVAHKLPRETGHGKTEAIRVSDSASKVHSVAVDFDNGVCTSALDGKSPRQEEGAHETAAILIQKLNQDGSSCGEPQESTVPFVDQEAVDGNNTLKIQVTRAWPGQHWETLSNSGHVTEKDQPPDVLAEQLWNAIERKDSKHAKGNADKSIILAIDARETAGYTLRPVIEAFRERQKRSGKNSYHFKEIWVVGSTVDLTFRLF